MERLNPRKGEIYKLKYQPLIINSETVWQDSILFQKNIDYSIDYQKGTIIFQTETGNIFLEYMIYPEELLDRFYYYQEQVFSDSLKIPKSKKRHQIFGENTQLSISGNKTISISVSNTENLDIDQSLFLKINGEISKELNIEAQLTDSQSPITPEGDSRQLSSLDKVFLRLYSKQYEISFGDLEMKFAERKFMNYTPQFEGLRVSYQNVDSYQAALAISKGKRYTQTFNGIEAKQGPYYLKVNEQGIQVVPGSETIFLNGNKLERGSDYTIDYAEGSITFTEKYFIASTSYIRTEFQYTDENYRQNMYLADTENNFWDRLKIKNALIIQIDDKNNPLLETFNTEEKNILQDGGDDDVWIDAIYPVENGEYNLSSSGNHYVYVGNDTTQTGNYNINFSYFGSGNGDYEYESAGDYYVFVGSGQGSYLPKKQLVSPEKKVNYDLMMQYKNDFLQFRTEGLFSYLDKNTFSSKDDEDNSGYAGDIDLKITPDYEFLQPKLHLNYRQKTAKLNTFAEIINPLDAYEMTIPPDSLASKEYSLRLDLTMFSFYRPDIFVRQRITDDHSKLDYFALVNRTEQKKFLPSLYHRLVLWKEIFDQSTTSEKEFEQNQLELNYEFTHWLFRFEHFQKELKSLDYSDQRQISKIQNSEYSIEYFTASKFASRIFLKEDQEEFREEESAFTEKKKTQTIGHELTINSAKHRIKTNISHREVQDSLSQKFDMATLNLQNSVWKDALNFNSRYTLQNMEFYPKIRDFIFVGEDQGSYDEDSIYVGYNEGDYDWEVTSIDYDNPKMSVQVNSNFMLHFNPANITRSYFRRFQTESQLMIIENSKARNKEKIYYLNPDYLMQENTTLFGKNLFQQILWWNLISDKLNLRLKYKNEKFMDNRYNDETERRFNLEHEAKMQIISVKNSNLEITYLNSKEENDRYDSEIENNSVKIEMLNRLYSETDLRSNIMLSQEKGNASNHTNEYEIFSYEIKEIISIFWKNKYRFISTVSYKHNERKGSEFLGFLQDKKDGNILKWKVNLNYRMSNYTSLKLEYSGDSYPDEKAEHQVTLEIKAEF